MPRSKKDNPKIAYRSILDKNDPKSIPYVNRLLVATPSTGMVRMEWVLARYGQLVPPNWSLVQMMEWIDAMAPMGYMVPDAQNVIVDAAVRGDFQWLLLIEHDNILPADAFIRFNQYMQEAKVPVVSGLYYTRSRPSEPLLYRGRGNSYYDKWKMGDKVWVDGVPTGTLLIHVGLLKEMWKEAEEYVVNGKTVRRVFRSPMELIASPDKRSYSTVTGTSDLDWCTRVMEGGYFEKSGWHSFQKKKYPFLVDTNIFVKHISPEGEMFP